mmetsp:Transcript_5480/g.15254  ORF Transcript_5480/g.15254 Transcript_5480/m.15254 type:complete len:513 (+) Transcript_5480:529-2067(+)
MPQQQDDSMYESANVDFNDIFSLRKPKDAKAGIASGLKSMAKGCLAGVIGVFAGPAIGACKAGMKGFCCGMLAGCVGACVLPSTGFAVGTVQICRGLINTPEAVMESLRGKVWDEERREWVDWHSLAVFGEKNEEPSESDRPRRRGSRGKRRLACGEGAEASRDGGEGAEGDYYSLLGVEEDASGDEIRKQYYVLARKWHPDKRLGDPRAKEHFQKLGEAYQVLSNPKLRAQYDRHGSEGLEANFIDASVFFGMLFGSEKFEHLVGELMISWTARCGADLSANELQRQGAKRERALVVNLTGLLQPYVDGDASGFREAMKEEAKQLASASFGDLMLARIGEAYVTQANIRMSGALTSAMSRVAQNWKLLQNQFAAANAALKVYRAHTEIQAVSNEADGHGDEEGTATERQNLRREMEEAAMPVMLEAMWAANVVDIQNVLRSVCRKVLQDSSVSNEVCLLRAQALKELGEIFLSSVQDLPDHGGRTAKDYIEAAMVQAMQRQGGMDPSDQEI